jgi:glycosyltransferase involved in cell wall biosynthesis
LLEVMKSASIFLFPSHEGAGMVVPEALSMGLPVVTLDNCGPGRFVEQSYGSVVATQSLEGTVDGIAKSLTRMVLDKKLYQSMRYEARRAFEQKFHWDRRGEKLKEIYQNF